MIRKELHLDNNVIKTLELEAKKQNRSLKNYLEYIVIEQAKKLQLPSKGYTEMMDKLLNDFDNKKIEFSTIEEVLERNGISNKGI